MRDEQDALAMIEPDSLQFEIHPLARHCANAPNGSSISNMAGSCKRALAIETRCCMPPESSFG